VVCCLPTQHRGFKNLRLAGALHLASGSGPSFILAHEEDMRRQSSGRAHEDE
jgi:hypothetical protein